MKNDQETEVAGVWEWNINGVSGLVRNRESGRYYSRFQVHGRRTMKGLKTDVFSVAKLKHLDNLAGAERQRVTVKKAEGGTARMGEILELAEAAHGQNSELSKKSKDCFASSMGRIRNHWAACFQQPIEAVKPDAINREDVGKFANYLHKEAKWRRNNTERLRRGYGPATVNVTIEALHRVLRYAKVRGFIFVVPFELTAELGEADVRKAEPRKKINFPSEEKVRAVFQQMRTVRSDLPENFGDLRPYLIRRAHESADLAEFMAYSGARVQEAVAWTWEDEREKTIFIRGTKTATSRDREVAKLPAMLDLLARMKARRLAEGRATSGRAFEISECRVALESACKRAGVDRWTHHTLRHLFATICIEANVALPTVACWLGHADRGVLAMQTYGHLRREHSLTEAAKVTFGVAA